MKFALPSNNVFTALRNVKPGELFLIKNTGIHSSEAVGIAVNVQYPDNRIIYVNATTGNQMSPTFAMPHVLVRRVKQLEIQLELEV